MKADLKGENSMFFTRKISKDVVAVVYDSPSIWFRNSGRKYYNTEIPVIQIQNSEIHINKNNAKQFGIEIIIDE